MTELAGEGFDLVYARVDYTLAAGAEVEALLTGWLDTNAAIDLTGNELGQQLWGNDAVNVLNGGGGNDILYGSAGADTLNGGSENEVSTAAAATTRWPAAPAMTFTWSTRPETP